jgi:predicted  nucleic acid-binding Zn-ribbon protein
MPRPKTERQAHEEELQELTTQAERYRQELDATPIEVQDRRERLEWQIRRAEKRMAEVRVKLDRGEASST